MNCAQFCCLVCGDCAPRKMLPSPKEAIADSLHESYFESQIELNTKLILVSRNKMIQVYMIAQTKLLIGTMKITVMHTVRYYISSFLIIVKTISFV